MAKNNILVVDDEPEIREALVIYLKSDEVDVFTASNGLEALQILEQETIHLILMDVMMPQLDGIKTTFKIRENKNIPIIMLSAKSEDGDKILGLNVGADDYITKPFNPLELVARVRSQLRRFTNLGSFQSSDEEIIQVRGLVLNKSSKIVEVDGEDVRLTPKEYKILELLMENKGRVFSIEEIYERVWNEPIFASENTVAVHVRNIREKIEINPKDPKYLKVVWGIGYKIEKK
ncbi:response regulator transcription factor [Paenibacillus radicis (ex Gao et al. 2016)]|uniref:DNA-binding response regulator n=1 Tax=Paenibacillus radicis (ex Gao et al. 2016) TaxID=1737354 RepID=A0A917M7G3_9BACL|nr:response regulator transcription factor [Paenibacillus radicis (ex Gao et al. 2016)]GGG83972.1 DNA-binding response regulator [Paenibacillus radicis (ex Gao et al. 2016)]